MAKLYAQKAQIVFTHSGSVAGNVLSSGSIHSAGYSKLRGTFRSDVASETGSGVRIEYSSDGQNWDIIGSSAVASACAASSFSLDVLGSYTRFAFKNGATAASAARAEIYLLPV